MNLDFSDEQKQLRDQVRRFLTERCPPSAVRAVLDGKQSWNRELWQELAELGYLGVSIGEEYGGLGGRYLELCVIAEELGRSLAPVPFSSSIYLAAEFLIAAGSAEQKQRYLPALAAGEAVGCFAFAEREGRLDPAMLSCRESAGRLGGLKKPVTDGDIADFAVVAARTGSATGDISLFIVDLKAPGVTRRSLHSIDPTRGQAEIDFSDARAEPLGERNRGWDIIRGVLDRAAVLFAFEQIGGADRALEMGRDYALERMAFGRQIGSFQAVKHMLADMYVSATLARSNCYYAAWALSTDQPELAQAAAGARVSATQAFQHCAKNNIQVHGGMGFTWEFDCHLYYRRSNQLALCIGSLSEWEDRLIEKMRHAQSA